MSAVIYTIKYNYTDHTNYIINIMDLGVLWGVEQIYQLLQTDFVYIRGDFNADIPKYNGQD